MRILINDYAGHPFQVQLSRELARRSHVVKHVYADFFQTPHGRLNNNKLDAKTFSIRSISIGGEFDKHKNWIKRRKQEIRYGAVCAELIDSFRPDVVISANTPLDAQRVIIKKCQALRIPFVFWVQDLYSVAIKRILSKKLPLLGWLIGYLYEVLEKRLLSQSDAIVIISEDFVQQMERWGIRGVDILTIPNWAPIDEIPVSQKDNPWAREHDVSETFNFVYTGTLGMKHNPELLLHLARELADKPEIRFVILSEGPGADLIKSKARQSGLDNVLVLGFQSFERYPEVLGSASVLVAILEQDASVFSVPSKVLSYLCAKRPLLLAVPQENLAARIVAENQAGIVVSPDRPGDFVNGAQRLYHDHVLRETMATNARRYAENNFNIRSIADKFETIIKSKQQ